MRVRRPELRKEWGNTPHPPAKSEPRQAPEFIPVFSVVQFSCARSSALSLLSSSLLLLLGWVLPLHSNPSSSPPEPGEVGTSGSFVGVLGWEPCIRRARFQAHRQLEAGGRSAACSWTHHGPARRQSSRNGVVTGSGVFGQAPGRAVLRCPWQLVAA